jgi:uncharacterized protein YfkK (UPF0435 family)
MKIFKVTGSNGKSLVKKAEGPSVRDYGRDILNHVVRAEEVLEEERRFLAKATNGGADLEESFRDKFESEYQQLIRTLEYSHTLADLMANGDERDWEFAKTHGITRKKFDAPKARPSFYDSDGDGVPDTPVGDRGTGSAEETSVDPVADSPDEVAPSIVDHEDGEYPDVDEDVEDNAFTRGRDDEQDVAEDETALTEDIASKISKVSESDIYNMKSIFRDIDEHFADIDQNYRNDTHPSETSGFENISKIFSVLYAIGVTNLELGYGSAKMKQYLKGFSPSNPPYGGGEYSVSEIAKKANAVNQAIYRSSSEMDDIEALHFVKNMTKGINSRASAISLMDAKLNGIDDDDEDRPLILRGSAIFNIIRLAYRADFDIESHRNRIRSHYERFISDVGQITQFQEAFVYYVEMMAKSVRAAYMDVGDAIQSASPDQVDTLEAVYGGLGWMGRLVQNMKARGTTALDEWEEVKNSGLDKMTPEEMKALVDDDNDNFVDVSEFWEAATEKAATGDIAPDNDAIPSDSDIQEAIKIVREDNVATTAHLQTRMNIDFSQAEMIMGRLEELGVLGRDENGNRKILGTEDVSKNQFLNDRQKHMLEMYNKAVFPNQDYDLNNYDDNRLLEAYNGAGRSEGIIRHLSKKENFDRLFPGNEHWSPEQDRERMVYVDNYFNEISKGTSREPQNIPAEREDLQRFDTLRNLAEKALEEVQSGSGSTDAIEQFSEAVISNKQDKATYYLMRKVSGDDIGEILLSINENLAENRDVMNSLTTNVKHPPINQSLISVIEQYVESQEQPSSPLAEDPDGQDEGSEVNIQDSDGAEHTDDVSSVKRMAESIKSGISEKSYNGLIPVVDANIQNPHMKYVLSYLFDSMKWLANETNPIAFIVTIYNQIDELMSWEEEKIYSSYSDADKEKVSSQASEFAEKIKSAKERYFSNISTFISNIVSRIEPGEDPDKLINDIAGYEPLMTLLYIMYKNKSPIRSLKRSLSNLSGLLDNEELRDVYFNYDQKEGIFSDSGFNEFFNGRIIEMLGNEVSATSGVSGGQGGSE